MVFKSDYKLWFLKQWFDQFAFVYLIMSFFIETAVSWLFVKGLLNAKYRPFKDKKIHLNPYNSHRTTFYTHTAANISKFTLPMNAMKLFKVARLWSGHLVWKNNGSKELADFFSQEKKIKALKCYNRNFDWYSS